ncbi:hypothetical protein BC829DRAFT_296404 [Chytridium lagenaria]|nr:hypothetical protein BC829DRAFT_296404 [Chytridium lagenaria]
MTHGLFVRKRDSTSSSSPDLAASDLSVYVAKYVRDMLEMKEKREALVKHLSGHQPFVETEFMAVAMIDISGFSALTSLFSEMLGKLSSEVISAGTGEYIEKIAPIVLGYGGDIVKFLGDALLVTFSSTEPDEDRNSIIRRAVLCCTDVLLEHPSHPIDVKRWANAMSSSTTSPKKHEPAHLSYSATRRLKRSEDLTLHAGITCGMVSRVIVGIPSLRLDYFVAGDCLKELGALLDEAKSGQLGLSTEVTKILDPYRQYKLIAIAEFCIENIWRLFVLKTHLWTAETAKGKRLAKKRLKKITHLSLSIRSIAASTASSNPYHMDVDTSLIPFFINQSVLLRIRASSIAPAPSPIPQLLTRRVTDFKSEYRTLSVLFVKPLSEFDVQKAQIYTEEFLKSLKANNGVFHQCSVDDKGQTFLACFGLPPFANETGCRNAIKTSIDFQAALKHRAPGSRFSMAIATGNIFFGTLGTRGRKEAGLLGEKDT